MRSPLYLLLVLVAVMVSSVFSAPHNHLGAAPVKATYAQPQYRLYFPQRHPQLYNYQVPYPAQYQYASAYPYYGQISPYA